MSQEMRTHILRLLQAGGGAALTLTLLGFSSARRKATNRSNRTTTKCPLPMHGSKALTVARPSRSGLFLFQERDALATYWFSFPERDALVITQRQCQLASLALSGFSQT